MAGYIDRHNSEKKQLLSHLNAVKWRKNLQIPSIDIAFRTVVVIFENLLISLECVCGKKETFHAANQQSACNWIK